MRESKFLACKCGGLLVPLDASSSYGVSESDEIFLCEKCKEVYKKSIINPPLG